MSKLSLSVAWDETRAILARDGRLFGAVALALLVLPAAVLGAFYPGGLGGALFMAIEGSSLPLSLLLILVFLVIATGQLAVTRLAIGPSVTVGGAISHAVRRLPAYIAVALIVGAAIMAVMFIAATAIAVIVGAPATEAELAKSPLVVVAVVVLFAVYLFLLTRIVSLSAAIATTEDGGPIHIIRRSWAITSGNFWRLLGYLVIYFIGTAIAVFAILSISALVFSLLFGRVEPMSASALLLSIVSALLNGCLILILALMLARIYVQLSGAASTQASVPKSGT